MYTHLEVREALLSALCAEMDKRNKCQDMTWILNEREAIKEAMDSESRRLGRPLVSMKDVERAETQASGHSDYSSKFALYCAELVVFGKMGRP